MRPTPILRTEPYARHASECTVRVERPCLERCLVAGRRCFGNIVGAFFGAPRTGVWPYTYAGAICASIDARKYHVFMVAYLFVQVLVRTCMFRSIFSISIDAIFVTSCGLRDLPGTDSSQGTI